MIRNRNLEKNVQNYVELLNNSRHSETEVHVPREVRFQKNFTKYRRKYI